MRVEPTATAPTAGTISTKDREDAKLRQACRDMESVFTGYLLKSMRETVQKTDLFGSERDESMFRDMLDDEVAKAASRQRGTGLAEMLYRQLSQLDKIDNHDKPLKGSDPTVEK